MDSTDAVLSAETDSIGRTTFLPTAPQNSDRLPVGADGVQAPRRGRGRPPKNRPEGTEPVRSDALPSPAQSPVSPHDKRAALELMTRIGNDFALNRQKSKSKAFETYQRDLATNAGTLVMGGAVTLKELTVLLMDLEAFMKSTLKEGVSPGELLAQFLRGDLAVEE